MNRNGIVAALAGVLFGLGLAISGMVDPSKVKDFLDVAAASSGDWDPSLAFVMLGAIAVAMPFFRLNGGLWGPSPGPKPQRAGWKIDGRLVGGSAIFGVGWGLSGLCPGPAIADLSLAPGAVALFCLAMVGGSWLAGLALRRKTQRSETFGEAPAE